MAHETRVPRLNQVPRTQPDSSRLFLRPSDVDPRNIAGAIALKNGWPIYEPLTSCGITPKTAAPIIRSSQLVPLPTLRPFSSAASKDLERLLGKKIFAQLEEESSVYPRDIMASLTRLVSSEHPSWKEITETVERAQPLYYEKILFIEKVRRFLEDGCKYETPGAIRRAVKAAEKLLDRTETLRGVKQVDQVFEKMIKLLPKIYLARCTNAEYLRKLFDVFRRNREERWAEVDAALATKRIQVGTQEVIKTIWVQRDAMNGDIDPLVPRGIRTQVPVYDTRVYVFFSSPHDDAVKFSLAIAGAVTLLVAAAWTGLYLAGYPPPQRLLLQDQRTALVERYEQAVNADYKWEVRDNGNLGKNLGDSLLPESLVLKRAGILASEKDFRKRN